MTEENFRHAADNAVLLLFARVAQIILVPLMAMLLAWTFSTLNSLQLDSAMLRGEIGKAIAVSGRLRPAGEPARGTAEMTAQFLTQLQVKRVAAMWVLTAPLRYGTEIGG